MIDEILYTPEELAQKLKISKYTIYEMIKRGDIQAHHVGRSIRVSQSQLNLYLSGSQPVENIFEGTIIVENGAKYALVNKVKISVVTPLEDTVRLIIRPEDIILSKEAFVSSARNIHKGPVTQILSDGASSTVLIDIGVSLSVLITTSSLNDMNINIGDELFAVFKTMAVKVIK